MKKSILIAGVDLDNKSDKMTICYAKMLRCRIEKIKCITLETQKVMSKLIYKQWYEIILENIKFNQYCEENVILP